GNTNQVKGRRSVELSSLDYRHPAGVGRCGDSRFGGVTSGAGPSRHLSLGFNRSAGWC
ncbi:hypothetical protein EMPG_17723, partial [Blastomyces silverae]